MKYIVLLLLFWPSSVMFSQQQSTYEKPPVFNQCENTPVEQLKTCFNFTLSTFIYENFEVPQIVEDEQYKGDVSVLFEVTSKGNFEVVYIDTYYTELEDEARRVFKILPEIEPATYNGNPTFVQYSIKIKIPLVKPVEESVIKNQEQDNIEVNNESQEIDNINNQTQPYDGAAFTSQLNIPFTHSYYARFDANLNAVGTNAHTAAKPYVYSDVSKYYNIKEVNESLKKETSSWIGRKLWNENLVAVQGKDYWFSVDPIADLQVGKDTEAEFNSTFNNTRGVIFQGGLGKKLNFYTSVFESQGRFAQYFNEYAESLGRPNSDTEVAIIPGRGIAKRFKADAYDYPVAEAYLSYAPSKNMNIIFGHGKNFIGDGYRSLLQSDVASPHTYLKLNTSFWKIKYTNTWMWLRDVRQDVLEDG
ncbi:MAG: gliding motility protein RemB, partial [Winogradskyella sp.]|nr:gliding motility protein RemB [Winogradskyella sp.]NNF85934.1 gliding motility protein RemB [Winogradskyella sp.]